MEGYEFYSREEISHGSWSEWQTEEPIGQSGTIEVQSRISEQGVQYRYRDIRILYTYLEYDDWSDYSDEYPTGDYRMDIRERTVYRYRKY